MKCRHKWARQLVVCKECGNNIIITLFNPQDEHDYTAGVEHFCHECDEATVHVYRKKVISCWEEEIGEVVKK